MAEKEKGQLGPETELCVSQGVQSVTEKRVVKLTPKALLEKISTLEKERKSKFSKLLNVKNSITKLMSDKEHISEVENEFDTFNKLCDEIQQVHTSLLGLLPAEEANKHEIWYQAKMLSFNEFFMGTNQWLYDTKACSVAKMDDDLTVQVETQTVDVNAENGNEIDASKPKGTAGGKDEEEEDQIQPQDSISNVQSRHRGSSSGSSSSRSSTSSARHMVRAEQAALFARAAALKDKHELEEQELILRRKKEQTLR